MKEFILLAASLFMASAVLPMGIKGLKKLGLNKKNYQGKSLPAFGGLIPIIIFLMIFSLMNFLSEAKSFFLVFIFFSLTILGLIDDFFGKGREKGFKGHFKAVLKGKITTGMLKAVGISVLALISAWYFSKKELFFLNLFLNAGLIALASNFINLLDLRPGRAVKTFLAFGFIINLAFRQGEVLWFYILSGTFIAYLPWDLKEKAMLGDTGANVLGFALGLLMTNFLGLPLKIIVIFVLFILHLYAESISFSKAIEENRYLRYLDLLGRLR